MPLHVVGVEKVMLPSILISLDNVQVLEDVHEILFQCIEPVLRVIAPPILSVFPVLVIVPP